MIVGQLMVRQVMVLWSMQVKTNTESEAKISSSKDNAVCRKGGCD